MTTSSQDGRPLTPVQEILACGAGYADGSAWDREPDAWLQLHPDASGHWSATMFGLVLDRSATDAMTVPLRECARLLAVAAAKARRPLVVHTTDEHGGRYVDVFDPPSQDFHQVPPATIDSAANGDAIRSGLSAAVWSPERVTWSPT